MHFRLTKTVKTLLIINIVVFVVQHTIDQYLGGGFITLFGLITNGVYVDLKIWQIITYCFLHGDVMHLFLNMLMLVFVGSEIESIWGVKRFLKFYFFCALVAGFMYMIIQLTLGIGGLRVPMIGASGAIYGLLIAYGILFGERVILFMLLFPMKAKQFIWILIGIEFLSTFFSHTEGAALSSICHLSGMGAGFIYLRSMAFILSKKRIKKVKRKKSDHLNLIVDNDENDKPYWH